MFRRAGCFVVLILGLLGVGTAALIWLFLTLLGIVNTAPVTRFLSGVGLVLGIGAFLLALGAVRRITRPATRLIDAAGRVEEGDYSVRVPVRGPGELRTLARAFNAMSSRLEANDTRRRSVLAEVAHELRTPIAVIRAQAEGIVDGVYPPEPAQLEPVLAALRSLEVLVDDIGALGLAEVGALRLRREPVVVATLSDDVLRSFDEQADAAGIRLDARVQPPDLTVNADPVRLRSVLVNLVGNALRYGHTGGAVTLRARAETGAAVIAVHDDGSGIDPALLPRIFDRFVKGPGSPGSGLGLAIVRDIVETHGGTITASSSPRDGTEFRIVLPAAA